jgi:hypothetical protein
MGLGELSGHVARILQEGKSKKEVGNFVAGVLDAGLKIAAGKSGETAGSFAQDASTIFRDGAGRAKDHFLKWFREEQNPEVVSAISRAYDSWIDNNYERIPEVKRNQEGTAPEREEDGFIKRMFGRFGGR